MLIFLILLTSQDLVLQKNGSDPSTLTACDKKNDTANDYSLDCPVDGEGEFKFFFKVVIPFHYSNWKLYVFFKVTCFIELKTILIKIIVGCY